MDGVGRGVAVRDHQPAGLIESAPVLLVGGIAIHGKHQRRCIGVHIAGMAAQVAVQILLHHGGGGLAVPGKSDVFIGDAFSL